MTLRPQRFRQLAKAGSAAPPYRLRFLLPRHYRRALLRVPPPVEWGRRRGVEDRYAIPIAQRACRRAREGGITSQDGEAQAPEPGTLAFHVGEQPLPDLRPSGDDRDAFAFDQVVKRAAIEPRPGKHQCGARRP